jgi:hypothetical protein
MFKAIMRWEWSRLTQVKMLSQIVLWSFLLGINHLITGYEGLSFMAVFIGQFPFDGYSQTSDFIYFRSRPLPNELPVAGKILSASIVLFLVWALTFLVEVMVSMAKTWTLNGAAQRFVGVLSRFTPHFDAEFLKVSAPFFLFGFLGLSYRALQMERNKILSRRTAFALAPTIAFILMLLIDWKFFGWAIPLYSLILSIVILNLVVAMLLGRFSPFSDAPAPSQALQSLILLFPMFVAIFATHMTALHTIQDPNQGSTVLTDEQLADYSNNAGPEKTLTVHHVYFGERAAIFATNGTSRTTEVTLTFTTLENAETSKLIPFKKLVPAGKEVYLMSVKQKQSGKAWKFYYHYQLR